MLDEIGDLPMSLQAKLLRFLQERKIERVGGRQEIAVDVRVVCATHQDLKAQIQDGRFREDLYYRLAEIVVEIPPLRERTGDAVLLAHAFLRRFAQEQRRGALSFSEDAVRAIEAARLARQRARTAERGQARGHHGRRHARQLRGRRAAGTGVGSVGITRTTISTWTCGACASEPNVKPSSPRWREPTATCCARRTCWA